MRVTIWTAAPSFGFTLTDSVFQIYKAMYAHDRTPLHAKQESVVQDSAVRLLGALASDKKVVMLDTASPQVWLDAHPSQRPG